MALFRTHREAARNTNRIIGRFFVAMTVVTLLVIVIVGVQHVLAW